jgi:hypothetical protein
MQPREEIEQQLWDYLDNRLHEAENTRVQQLIATDTTWKTIYQQLLALQTTLKTMDTEHPSMRFSKNVMESIAATSIAPKASRYINHRAMLAIMAAFSVLLVIFFSYTITQIDWSGVSSSQEIPTVSFNWIYNPIVQTTVMILVVMLSLLFIDGIIRKKHTNNTASL